MKTTASLSLLGICFLALPASANTWITDTQEQWQNNSAGQTHLEFAEGMATPTATSASYSSKLQSFEKKQKATSIEISQSPVWQNWNPVANLGPANLGDSPIFLQLGPKNYWMFGRYKGAPNDKGKKFTPEDATLEGFDMPLKTTPWKNQFKAPGGLSSKAMGYHAWQSRDMVNWVHHGAISDKQSAWMTNAEYVNGKAYFYYDFPNDQDPHLIIDDNLFDGNPGEFKGMVFKDPSDGSDAGIIRDLEGNFHLILENFDPIKASTRSWDSPLASHAVSKDGINDFRLVGYAVDYRTKRTGKVGSYKHPHWAKEDPDHYKTGIAYYEIHEPEQPAYGDWAAIAIGGQYYLFGDYDPVGAHGQHAMSVAWFTSGSINEQFTFCDHIGKGHPDPDVVFAEGQFYLATQMKTDYVSPGPWVESVEVRVGVDTDNDQKADHWSEWRQVRESYDYIEGFAKQVARTPASLNLSELPEGYGFCYEIKITDTTENKSKPILDKVTLHLAE
ncbi:MAG: hypothetical protein ACPHVK_09975 [Akkermansiaceae bacterium]